jgi:hypothetical protein
MSAPATELRPHAVGGVVYNDVVSRTLFVQLPDAAGGHDRSLWRQAYQRLVAAEQAGWPLSAPGCGRMLPASSRLLTVCPAMRELLSATFRPGRPSTRSWLVSRG